MILIAVAEAYFFYPTHTEHSYPCMSSGRNCRLGRPKWSVGIECFGRVRCARAVICRNRVLSRPFGSYAPPGH